MKLLINKPLKIPSDWKVFKNHFLDLEPDNDLPIKQVWHYFDEDISLFEKGEFFIDLGFGGGAYLEDRSGFFKLIVAKGNFEDITYYESFFSRSTDDIKDKIEFYMKLISNGEIQNYEGLAPETDETLSVDFDLYSSIHQVKKKLTLADFNELAKSTK